MLIFLLGDSIAAGLGVAGCSYADGIEAKMRQARVEAKVVNLAGTANQLSSSLNRLVEITASQPEYVIIAHGTTEGIVRPAPESLRFVPARWRQIGWLDPRPYFSRRLWKSLYHRAESGIRWRIKVTLIKKYGGHTLTSAEDFERMLTETVDTLLQQTSATIILLTHNGIDERFYPGSLFSLSAYQKSILRVAAENRTERVRVCDISHLLCQWSDFFADHFHPNANGHAKIAEALSQVILSAQK